MARLDTDPTAAATARSTRHPTSRGPTPSTRSSRAARSAWTRTAVPMLPQPAAHKHQAPQVKPMSRAGALRYTSTAALPDRMRQMVEAQGKGTSREAATKPESKPNKYHNHPTTVDGIRFDSKKEARYYEQLLIRQKLGEVQYFLMQVPLRLPGGTKYVVDFLVFFADPGKPPEYVDVKGKLTQVFRLKKREVEHQYPIQIRCV